MQISDMRGGGRGFICENPGVEIVAKVSGGIIKGTLNTIPSAHFTSNISTNGKFYAEIPRKSTYLINGRSRFEAREYHVVSGTLTPSKNIGEAVYISAFGMPQQGGCKYPAVLHKRAE